LIGALLFAANVHCATSGAVKACKTFGDEQAGRTLRITRAGKLLYQRNEPDSMMLDDIDVQQRDLDGDGAKEIVAADVLTVSNGMGVTVWTLVIIDGRTNKATTLQVEDYGPGSVRKDGVLETSWEWIDGHLYFIARPYKYEHGALVKQKTMWQRRYLFSFQRERGKGGPAQWLKKATKVPWRSRDPLQ
jgi:hypothetical protein